MTGSGPVSERFAAPRDGADARADQVVFVCTANLCRSPMAAGLFARDVAAAGYGSSVIVGSAGVAITSLGIPGDAVAVMAPRGVDTRGHWASALTVEMISTASLLVVMERRHLTRVVEMMPTAFGRTFTLVEVARRCGSVAPRAEGESVAQWVARLHDGRRASDLFAPGNEDDLPDPYGQSRSAYERCAARIEGHVAALVRAGWP